MEAEFPNSFKLLFLMMKALKLRTTRKNYFSIDINYLKIYPMTLLKPYILFSYMLSYYSRHEKHSSEDQ
jgi:hypothetical protein